MKGQGMVRFIPTPLSELATAGHHIINKLKEKIQSESKVPLLQFIHPNFIQTLEERLKEKADSKDGNLPLAIYSSE
jgi:hypothetical protein